MNTSLFFLSLFLPLREKVSHTLFICGFYFIFLYIFVYFHLNWDSSVLKRKLNIKRLPLFGWIQAEIMQVWTTWRWNIKMKWKWQGRSYFSEGFCKQSCTSENMFLLTKCFWFFFTITLKHIQDLRESSVGRLLSLNSWCGIKSYTISFLSLTQEASQGKTSYVHQHLFAFDEAMQCMYVKIHLDPCFRFFMSPW